MAKSVKIILIIAAVLVALGFLLAAAGFIMGVRPAAVFKAGIMDVAVEENRHNQVSADGRYTAAAEGIHEIELSWTAGSVKVRPYDGSEIQMHESSSAELGEKYALSYYVKEGQLHIDDYPARVGVFFSEPPTAQKDLELLIPADMLLDEFSLNAVSADFYMEELKLMELSVETVSGDIELSKVFAREFEADSVDGNISIKDCHLAEADVNTVSGSFSADFSSCPKELDFESVSGNAELYLPSGSEFSLSMESIGRKLNSEFEGFYDGDRFVSGSGSAEFEFQSVSGKVNIHKKS